MKKEIERYEQEMQEKHNASVLQAIKELDQKIWSEQVIFAEKEELEKKYPMPSAFAAYQL